jgi:hypothetical protein
VYVAWRDRGDAPAVPGFSVRCRCCLCVFFAIMVYATPPPVCLIIR